MLRVCVSVAISHHIMKLQVVQNLDTISKVVFCDPILRGFDGLSAFGPGCAEINRGAMYATHHAHWDSRPTISIYASVSGDQSHVG